MQTTVNSKNVINGLTRLIKNLEFTKPLKDTKKLIDQQTQRNFDTQGYTLGRAWTPLAVSTREQRAREGYGPARPILVRSGGLRRSFNGDIKSNTLIYKSNSKIFPYHQLGTRKMRQRKMLDVTEKLRMAIGKTFGNFIADIIRKYYG